MRNVINQQTNGRLSEERARIYLAELILAIEEVHRNGIVHRDIKPENVLIDKGGHACLSDFGLAKQGLFEQKQTDTMLGGGQSYQIPEVLLGKTYDKTVDLYLYGLLAYEMITGQTAFPMRNSEEEQEQRIKTCTFTFPDEDPSQAVDQRGCKIDLTYSEVSDSNTN